jgi:hypothetical protein
MKIDRKWLLRLYPRAWRNRYEDEFTALLEQCPFSLSDLLDIFLGAIDARLHPHVPRGGEMLQGGISLMVQRLRRAMLIGLCAYIGFFVAGVAFEETTNTARFVELTGYLPRYYPVFTVSSYGIAIGLAVALLAVMIGGIPIAWAVIRRAASVARKDLLFWAVPLFAFVVLLAGNYVLLAVEDNRIALPTGIAELVGVTYLVMLVVGAIASAAAVSLAITRSTVSEQFFQFALIPATVAIGAMGLTLSATIAWGVSLNVDAPWLFNSDIYYRVYVGGVVKTTVAGAWLTIVVVMAASTVMAVLSVIRTRSIQVTSRRIA